ncbi:hypothetical protein G6F68_011886 [Rhizopus microsporus]|nr:hypothetical protein G6F68_011886 [Rhizopus microsporus]
MDSATYQHILGTTLKDSVDYYGINWSSWYFQQDNDPKHKSKSTLKWLQDNRVNVISDWPAQSPDLNPMEHIWRQLKLNLSLYKTHAKNTQELWERIEKEWNKFDKDLCCKYIDTMPDRIRALKAMDAIMPKSLSQDMRNDIRSALLNSREPKDIANDLGIHASTVRRYRKRFFPQQSPLPAGRHYGASGI